MRPYFAIVKDSFREAIRSKVLWAVLILLTLALAILAPLGISKPAITGLAVPDLLPIDAAQLVLQLRAASLEEEPSASKWIYDKLSESTRKRVDSAADGIVEMLSGAFEDEGEVGPDGPGPGRRDNEGTRGEVRKTVDSLRDELGELLGEKDFYDAVAWKRVGLRPEALELKKRGLDDLSDEELRRFNRVALESAYPSLIRNTPSRGYIFTYLGYELHNAAITLPEDDFREAVAFVITNAMTWIFGTLGLLIALIATAPIMPQTFEPGSLSLLLSKPIYRWATFVAKFVGGCAFVTVAITYLTLGLMLIFGIRLGIWDWRYLYYIPMFVFAFAIYYSVSAVAGAFFRNTIVALVLVVAFWLSCLGVWVAKTATESVVIYEQTNLTLIEAGDDLLAVTFAGDMVRWDGAVGNWEPTFLAADDRARGNLEYRLGPTYDASRRALFAQRAYRQPFGMPSMPEMWLSFGTEDTNWQRRRGLMIGAGAQSLFVRPELKVGEGDDAKTLDRTLILAGPLGLREITADPLQPANAAARFNPMSLFAGTGPFKELTERLDLAQPSAFAMHPASGDVLAYARGELIWFRLQPDGKYEIALRKKLDGDEADEIALDVGGPRDAPLAALAREGGSVTPIRLVAGETPKFELLKPFSPEGDNVPRKVLIRPDGSQIAVLFHVGELWIWDAKTQTARAPSVRGQGSLSAVAWFGDDRLAVSDTYLRTSIVGADDYDTKSRHDVPSSFWLGLYRWLILPVYTIFPKPGELDRTMTWLMTGKSTQTEALPQIFGSSLDAPRPTFDPITPVWSGLLFIGVMLALGSWWFTRQEY